MAQSAARKASAALTVILTLVLALASAGLLFLLLYLSPSLPSAHPHPHPYRHLRLRGARLGYGGAASQHQILFDPLIADIEHRLDDRKWERLAAVGLHAPGMESAPVPEDLAFTDTDEDYINDEARFNMMGRVQALLPKIDVDPADGAVMGAELAAWNLTSTRADGCRREEGAAWRSVAGRFVAGSARVRTSAVCVPTSVA